jgi:hypothetical protein
MEPNSADAGNAMSPERNFPEERRRFERAVGAAILAVGELEFQTVYSIAVLENVKPLEIWKIRQLDQRVKRLRDAIALLPTSKDKQLLALASQMQILGKRRNDIAHNPIHYQIMESGFDQFVVETPSGRTLSVMDIEAIAIDATRACDAFGTTMMELGRELGRF